MAELLPVSSSTIQAAASCYAGFGNAIRLQFTLYTSTVRFGDVRQAEFWCRLCPWHGSGSWLSDGGAAGIERNENYTAGRTSADSARWQPPRPPSLACRAADLARDADEQPPANPKRRKDGTGAPRTPPVANIPTGDFACSACRCGRPVDLGPVRLHMDRSEGVSARKRQVMGATATSRRFTLSRGPRIDSPARSGRSG
jgi:hypothetical protein